MFLVIGAAAVCTGLLSVVLRAAGDDVSLGVAIAALVVMVLTVVHLLATYAGALRGEQGLTPDEESQQRFRRTSLTHLAVLWSMPLVVTAAWPWGPASPVIGWAALLACQAVQSHGLIVVAMLARRRARQAAQG